MTDTKRNTKVCEFCGSDFSRTCEPKSYVGNWCFECSFWFKKINLSEEDKSRQVIANGSFYRLGSVHSGPFRGFGGRKFTVLFHDGRVVGTSNLWHQGEIPERFKGMFPDNAILVPAIEIQTPPFNKFDIPF